MAFFFQLFGSIALAGSSLDTPSLYRQRLDLKASSNERRGAKEELGVGCTEIQDCGLHAGLGGVELYSKARPLLSNFTANHVAI